MQFVRVERSSNQVATIRIDRPPMNAMTFELLTELVEAASQLADDRDVRAVVIWGGPTIFSAGIDVGRFVEHSAPSFRDLAHKFTDGIGAISTEEFTEERPSPSELVHKFNTWISAIDAADHTGDSTPSMGDLIRKFNHWITAIERIPQITVSAVNGAAVGSGLDLALVTDFRVVARDATLAQPEIKHGIVPGCGATHMLPWLVGLDKAREMIYTGDPVDPEEALRIGLVSAVCAPEETYDAAMEMAARFATGPAALRFAKQAIRTSMDLPLEQAVTREANYAAQAIATKDAAIGLANFLDENPSKVVYTGH